MFVIEKREALEIYAGDTGFVVIKQPNEVSREDDYIFIHPDDIPQIIEYLSSVRADAYEIRAELAKEKSAV